MDVNFTLERGKVLTIVGESGSGKTTVIRALMGLLPVGGEVTEGTLLFNGKDLRNLSKAEWRSIRGKDMAMIFQDSGSALDPIVRIGKQFRELFKAHIEITNDECDRRAIALLESVALPNCADILRRYPHELSGGQRQRVGIAMALALDPALLIGDEPTSALDIRNQVIVLETIDQLRAQGYAIIFTTHLPEQELLLNSRVGLCRGGSIDFYDSVSDVTLEALEEIYKTKLSLFYSDTVNRTVCVIPQLGQKGM